MKSHGINRVPWWMQKKCQLLCLSFFSGRNNITYLVDQLIEGVLTICSRLTPNNWSGAVVHLLTGFGYKFAVALHVALLEVSCESVQVLIVWQQCVGLSSIKIGIPNAQQSQDDRSLKLNLKSNIRMLLRVGKVFELLHFVRVERF